MIAQLTKCPDCGGPLPDKHGLEENCQYCGALLKFERSTLERNEEKPKNEVKLPPVQGRGTRPKQNSYSHTQVPRQMPKSIRLGVTLILLVVTVALLIGFVNAFRVGEKNPSTNPENQVIAPTAMILEVPTNTKWWDENIELWMTSVESESLREAENAVNYVVFDSSEIRYAANVTISSQNESWENKRPYFIEAVSVIGTGAVVQVQGEQYNFNVYQPMTWKGAPNIIFMIDADTKIWVINTTYFDVETIDLDDVKLQIVVNPNQNLEIGYIKN